MTAICLIISKEHRCDFFELTDDEREELPEMILKAKELIEESHEPNGYNIGMNCGEAAGQTVFHFHCHVIPRYEGDMTRSAGWSEALQLKGRGIIDMSRCTPQPTETRQATI
ncbi:MAG: HIT family protein [Melioribacteraceae bacterium]|nr:HIT family protein [Melioribacteraceae bacterium]